MTTLDPNPVFEPCPQCGVVRPHLNGPPVAKTGERTLICMRCDTVHTARVDDPAY